MLPIKRFILKSWSKATYELTANYLYKYRILKSLRIFQTLLSCTILFFTGCRIQDILAASGMYLFTPLHSYNFPTPLSQHLKPFARRIDTQFSRVQDSCTRCPQTAWIHVERYDCPSRRSHCLNNLFSDFIFFSTSPQLFNTQ